MRFDQVVLVLKDYGLPLAMLVLLAFTGARKMWVFGWTLGDRDAQLAEKDKEIQRERTRADWWQQRCLDQSSMLDRSIELAMRGVQGQRQAGG